MAKPKNLTKEQKAELLEQKRAAKAYCDKLAERNEFDWKLLGLRLHVWARLGSR